MAFYQIWGAIFSTADTLKNTELKAALSQANLLISDKCHSAGGVNPSKEKYDSVYSLHNF